MMVGAALVAFVGMSGCVQQPAPPAPPASGIPIGTCFRNTEGAAGDILYTGPNNTKDNVALFATLDGSCSGPIMGTSTYVHASDHNAAILLCQGLIPGWTAVPLSHFTNVTPGFPLNAYGCNPFNPFPV